MILCDFNMVVIANVVSHLNNNSGEEPTIEGIRHIILNSLRSYSKQFRAKYGQLVLCCDSRSYWRKEVFPYYKAGRKRARAASKINWKFVYEALDTLRPEIAAYMPYRVIEVEGAEGDDIIAVLAKKYCQQEPILILSSDKDYVQLQKYPNIKQWNPLFKRFVSVSDPLAFTKEHIIRGDFGDGIPNYLSNDNCLAIGERQKSINTDKLEVWMKQDPKEFCTETTLKNYHRNKLLIDLDCIPQELTRKIELAYTKNKPASKMTTLNYFMDKNLRELAEVLDEF